MLKLFNKIKANPIKLLTIVIIIIGFLLSVDIIQDIKNEQSLEHINIEIILITLCLGVLYFIKELFSSIQCENISLRSDIEQYKESLQEWRNNSAKLTQGLSVEIDKQFSKWSFSQAENDIARLLLKGMSIKEIAEIRGTSEKTIKQQTVSIYSKSGLSGRAELAAFFLEDLLFPINTIVAK